MTPSVSSRPGSAHHHGRQTASCPQTQKQIRSSATGWIIAISQRETLMGSSMALSLKSRTSRFWWLFYYYNLLKLHMEGLLVYVTQMCHAGWSGGYCTLNCWTISVPYLESWNAFMARMWSLPGLSLFVKCVVVLQFLMPSLKLSLNFLMPFL